MPDFDFFSLTDHSIPNEQIPYTEDQKVDICQAFDEVSEIINITLGKVQTIRLFLNSLI